MVRRCSDLQRDALIAAGVKPSRLYEDEASGKKDDRPGLNACSSLCVRATRWSSGSSTGLAATSVTSSTPLTT
jgi:hypothetical protein